MKRDLQKKKKKKKGARLFHFWLAWNWPIYHVPIRGAKCHHQSPPVDGPRRSNIKNYYEESDNDDDDGDEDEDDGNGNCVCDRFTTNRSPHSSTSGQQQRRPKMVTLYEVQARPGFG